jgi:hypothetical protein
MLALHRMWVNGEGRGGWWYDQCEVVGEEFVLCKGLESQQLARNEKSMNV